MPANLQQENVIDSGLYMNPETIKAFGSLWPFFLILFAAFWLWYFRKPIRSFLDKTTNIQLKRGQTEVLLSQQTKELSESEKVQPKGEEVGSELTKPPTNETLTSGEDTSKELFDRMFEAAAQGDADKLEEALKDYNKPKVIPARKLAMSQLICICGFLLVILKP